MAALGVVATNLIVLLLPCTEQPTEYEGGGGGGEHCCVRAATQQHTASAVGRYEAGLKPRERV